MKIYSKDSGYSCLVALSAHVCVFLYDGFTRGLGVMLPTLQDQFMTDTTTLGSIIALMNAVGSIASLSAGALSETIPTRWIVIIAGIATFLGALMSSLTSNITMLALSLTLITGLTIRFPYVLLVAELGNYFDAYFAVSCGVASAGSGTGIMIFAPLTTYLLDEYGWRGTMMISAALTLHFIPCSFALKRYVKFDSKPTKFDDTTPLIINSKPTEINSNYINAKVNKTSSPKSTVSQIIDICSKSLGLTLFFDISFVVVFVTIFFDECAWAIWVIYLVPYASTKLNDPLYVTCITTFGPISNIVFKVLLTYITDKSSVEKRFLLVITLFVSGVALICFTYISSWHWLLFISIVFQGAAGGTFALSFGMLNEFTTHFSLTRVVSWIILASGLARLAGGSITGLVFDQSGDYALAFNCCGGSLIVTAGVVFMHFVRNKWHWRKH